MKHTQDFKSRNTPKQQKQRLKYYKHRRKAMENPKCYLSAIINGTDQEKNKLPSDGTKHQG